VPQQPTLVRSGPSKAGEALQALVKAGELVKGSLVYVETWEYSSGAYLSHYLWGVLKTSCAPPESGIFLQPLLKPQDKWKFVLFKSVREFKLFELKATTFGEEE